MARAAEADRRARDPARLARARGLRRQARRPRAPPPPRPGARLRLRGGVLRRRQGPHDRAGRRGRDPLRGPRRRPGHARDAARHRGARRRGARRRGRADHRRPLLGRDARPDGRPHRAGGRARRPDRRASATATRSCSTSSSRRLDLEIPAEELAARLADWTPPAPRYSRGVFAKYAAARRLGLGGSDDVSALAAASSLRMRARRLARSAARSRRGRSARARRRPGRSRSRG